jgi:hypothetical protein
VQHIRVSEAESRYIESIYVSLLIQEGLCWIVVHFNDFI